MDACLAHVFEESDRSSRGRNGRMFSKLCILWDTLHTPHIIKQGSFSVYLYNYSSTT